MAYLKQNDISIEDVCIVGSAVLDLYRIRKARDLDFIVCSKHPISKSRMAVKVTESGKIEKVSKNWLSVNRKVIYSDDEIIDNPILFFQYKGFKVAQLPLVIFKKSITRREKDLKDLKHICELYDDYNL